MTPKIVENVQEGFDYIMEQIIDIRGDLLASRIVGGLAMQFFVNAANDPTKVATQLHQLAIRAINETDIPGGRTEADEKYLSHARLRVDQMFEQLRREPGLKPN